MVHDLDPGDVVTIPAGVAHKNLGSTGDFGVVGAYSQGLNPDMHYGRPGEKPRSDSNIRRVALPKADPILGVDGKLGRALVAIMLFFGQNAAEVLHGYGIAAAALASGGKVLKIQPWHFLGLPYTCVTDLTTSGAIITV
jgi:hypothetical protein